MDPPGELEASWEHVQDHDWFKSSPANTTRDILDQIVPVGLHGDDVQTFKRSSAYKVLVMQLSFILARAEH